MEELADSSYNVTFKVTVKNYGTADLKQVQLSDSLIAGIVAPVFLQRCQPTGSWDW
jgi:hypothetical protein